MLFSNWKSYDPTWLIHSSKYKFEEFPWLEAALENCTWAEVRSPYYTYFEKSSRANQQGSNWQFQNSIWIRGTSEGDLVLDIIEHNKVGGIEFYDRL